jgi:hypothetical protein
MCSHLFMKSSVLEVGKDMQNGWSFIMITVQFRRVPLCNDSYGITSWFPWHIFQIPRVWFPVTFACSSRWRIDWSKIQASNANNLFEGIYEIPLSISIEVLERIFTAWIDRVPQGSEENGNYIPRLASVRFSGISFPTRLYLLSKNSCLAGQQQNNVYSPIWRVFPPFLSVTIFLKRLHESFDFLCL